MASLAGRPIDCFCEVQKGHWVPQGVAILLPQTLTASSRGRLFGSQQSIHFLWFSLHCGRTPSRCQENTVFTFGLFSGTSARERRDTSARQSGSKTLEGSLIVLVIE